MVVEEKEGPLRETYTRGRYEPRHLPDWAHLLDPDADLGLCGSILSLVTPSVLRVVHMLAVQS